MAKGRNARQRAQAAGGDGTGWRLLWLRLLRLSECWLEGARTGIELADGAYAESLGWRGSSRRFSSSASTLIATSNAEIARIGKTTIHQASRMKCCPLCSR